MTDAGARAKRNAAERAVDAVEDGMTVGLGTGSTTAHAVAALGERVEAGLDIRGVPTSFQSRQLARETEIPVQALEDTAAIDLAIDGADQVVDGDCIKGGGGSQSLEKVVDATADTLHLVVDESKLADAFSTPVPVAVLPDARRTVGARLRDLGGEPVLRGATEKSGPVVTDNGNLILDCQFDSVDEPHELATSLDSVAGVVEHGLFVGLIDTVHVGTPEDSRTIEC